MDALRGEGRRVRMFNCDWDWVTGGSDQLKTAVLFSILVGMNIVIWQDERITLYIEMGQLSSLSPEWVA